MTGHAHAGGALSGWLAGGALVGRLAALKAWVAELKHSVEYKLERLRVI